MRDKGKLIAVIDEGTKTARVVVCMAILISLTILRNLSPKKIGKQFSFHSTAFIRVGNQISVSLCQSS